MKVFSDHKGRVNDLSLDGGDEFVASCSDDGTVVVRAQDNTVCLAKFYTPAATSSKPLLDSVCYVES